MRDAIRRISLAGVCLSAGCVISGGRPWFVWAVPPVPPLPSPEGGECELQPGSGSLVRVLVEDEQGAPLPGVAVELRRAGEEPRVYATGNDGNADAWVPNGHWMIRARLTNFHRAEGTLDVASDRFCRMTFRLPLDPPDRVAY